MKQEAIMARKAATRPVALTAVVIAAAAALPGIAEAKAAPVPASNWNATVIAKDSDRGRVITAGRGGEVRTLITSKRLAERARPGQRLKVRVQRSADGTYEARRLRVTGKAKRTRVRGAVVDRNASRYLVSAGGSVFAVKTKANSRKLRVRVSAAAVDTGDVIVSDVKIAANGLGEQRTRDIGNVTTLELEGIFLGLEDGALTLAVEERGAVKVAVPADLAVQAPAAGDELEVLVSIDADGGFTLIALADEDGGIDFDHEDGKVEIEGTISALTDTSISVQGRGGVALTCAIPSGATLTGFAVGDEVELECGIATDGGFTLRALESETAEFEFEDEEHEDDEDDRD